MIGQLLSLSHDAQDFRLVSKKPYSIALILPIYLPKFKELYETKYRRYMCELEVEIHCLQIAPTSKRRKWGKISAGDAKDYDLDSGFHLYCHLLWCCNLMLFG